MKKILICLLLIPLLLTGCGKNMNSPTKKVEELLGKYQSMDSEVLSQLDDVVQANTTMSNTQKDEYRSLMQKQYQNLSYKIKNETVNGDSAVVDVEIEVFDYARAIAQADKYILEHEEEFKNNDGNTDNNKFMKYKIKQMQKVTDKVKYTLSFDLEKDNNVWRINIIPDEDITKIHGLYND